MRKRPYEFHGMTGAPEHQAWVNMRYRCTNPNWPGFQDYGGRGIKVCERWTNSFSAFYSDMGPRPGADYSIDRIEHNGNYEPSNCHWATDLEQLQNTRKNIYWTHNGETLCLREWARRLGINHKVLANRIRKGWPDNLIVARPIHRDQSMTNLHFIKHCNKWQARGRRAGEVVNIGLYPTVEEARKARDEFAAESRAS